MQKTEAQRQKGATLQRERQQQQQQQQQRGKLNSAEHLLHLRAAQARVHLAHTLVREVLDVLPITRAGVGRGPALKGKLKSPRGCLRKGLPRELNTTLISILMIVSTPPPQRWNSRAQLRLVHQRGHRVSVYVCVCVRVCVWPLTLIMMSASATQENRVIVVVVRRG